MLSLGPDIRFACRLLRKTPGFSVAVLAVLALGIGANAALFSTLDQTVIRPLPYADPDRLAMVFEDFSAFGTAKARVSPGTFFDWRRRTRTFEGLAALRQSGMNLAESGAPEEVTGAAVTANLLPLLGVQPLAGRVLSVEEEPPGHRVVVLSERLWRRRFNRDPSLVGRSIVMSGEPYTVVGIMPAGFHFPTARTEFWVPIGLRPQMLTARNSHFLHVVGRVRRDAGWNAVRDDMRDVARQLAREYPATNDRVGITVTPLKEEVTRDAGRALLLLFGAAAAVLLIACANVANLLLARGSRRRREIAVRLALGASRGRVVGQLISESLVLSVAGGAAGLIVARWCLQVLTRFVPPALSSSIELHLDARALMFTTVATVATALLFGMAPALQSVSRSLVDNLKANVASGDDRRGVRLRDGLVVAEIAMALVLVVGAALLIDTLVHLRAVDPGFRADHVLTAQIAVPYPKYADAARRQGFYSNLEARVKELPGVTQVGLTSDLPYTSRGNTMSLKIENQATPRGLAQDALFRLVSPDYLQTIGARLRAGRFLDDRDRQSAAPAVVINDALAREVLAGGESVGPSDRHGYRRRRAALDDDRRRGRGHQGARSRFRTQAGRLRALSADHHRVLSAVGDRDTHIRTARGPGGRAPTRGVVHRFRATGLRDTDHGGDRRHGAGGPQPDAGAARHLRRARPAARRARHLQRALVSRGAEPARDRIADRHRRQPSSRRPRNPCAVRGPDGGGDRDRTGGGVCHDSMAGIAVVQCLAGRSH